MITDWKSVKDMLVQRNLSAQYVVVGLNYWIKAIDGNFSVECLIPIDESVDDTADFVTNFKANGNKPLVVNSNIITTPPFAEPLYRTKHDASPTITEVAPGTAANLDFLFSEERYIYGGEMIAMNAQFGDYVQGSIIDLNGIIPVPYRAALCENYPIVADYVLRRWIVPANSQGYSVYNIDTRPLIAKITAGLYLRITYNATAEGTTRKFVINNHLIKKL